MRKLLLIGLLILCYTDGITQKITLSEKEELNMRDDDFMVIGNVRNLTSVYRNHQAIGEWASISRDEGMDVGGKNDETTRGFARESHVDTNDAGDDLLGGGRRATNSLACLFKRSRDFVRRCCADYSRGLCLDT